MSMTVDEIQAQLNDVTEELTSVRAEIFTKMRAQHGQADSMDGFDCSKESDRRLQELKDQVVTLVGSMDGTGPESTRALAAKVSEQERRVKELTAQAAACQAVMQALGDLCKANELIQAVDGMLARGDFPEATRTVLEAERLVASVHKAAAGERGDDQDKENRAAPAPRGGPSESQTDPQVLRLLKRHIRKRCCALEDHLRDTLVTAVDVEQEAGCIRVTKVISGYFSGRAFRSSVRLVSLLECLSSLDLLDDFLRELATRLRGNMLGPLMTTPHVNAPQVMRSETHASLSYAPRRRSPTADAGGSSMDSGLLGVSEVMARVTTVLKFLWEEVLDRQAPLSEALGQPLVRDKGSGLLRWALGALEHALPDHAAELPAMRALAGPCREFEEALLSMGYVTGGDWGPGLVASPLSHFMARLTGHFAANRRRKLLVSARALMLQDYHNSVQVSDSTERSPFFPDAGSGAPSDPSAKGNKKGQRAGGDTRVFVLPPCHVTGVAKGLVDMAHATLQEACCSDVVPPVCALELYRTARDMLDLFRAVVPVQHGEQIASVPRIAALFHNDCLYLSHHLLTMGHMYRAKLPPPLDTTATMVDMVPLFRELGEARFMDQLEKQREQLREFLEGVDFLYWEGTQGRDDSPEPRRVADVEEAEQAARAVQRIVHHFKQLRQAWQHQLPEDVYHRVMGSLLGGVSASVLGPALRCQEFAEEQTHQLHQRLADLAEVQQVFEPPASAELHAPFWRKLRTLGDLMEYSLEQIEEELPKGTFQDFSGDELTTLICAIFQESPARSNLLGMIQTM